MAAVFHCNYHTTDKEATSYSCAVWLWKQSSSLIMIYAQKGRSCGVLEFGDYSNICIIYYKKYYVIYVYGEAARKALLDTLPTTNCIASNAL